MPADVGAHGGAPSPAEPVSAVCPPNGGRTADSVLVCSELSCTEKAATAAGGGGAAAPVDEEEIQYSLAVERAFQELGGPAVPVAPQDAAAVKSWYEAGVDFETICRCFREKASSSGLRDASGRPIRTLRYFQDVVMDTHRQILAIRGPWANPRAPTIAVPTIDVTARLAALSAALPPELPDRETWSRRVVELEGNAEEVEERLEAVDRQVLDAADAMLDAQDRRELEKKLSKAVAHLGQRLSAQQLRRTEEQLRERLMRKKLSLPVLSLFSPEAGLPPLQEAAA